MKTIPLALALLTFTVNASSQPLPAAPVSSALSRLETAAERDRRMAWWREARFGMFIHWGLYSVPAGTWNGKRIPGIGEWIMNFGEIPVADYTGLAARFNPVRFNAAEWVAVAKKAGMKYIVITSKHHDGFAMFKSAASAFNIVDATPFHRDPLQELATACREAGLKLGFYYSQAQDWSHPGGAAIKRNGRKTGHWDRAQDGDMDTYLRTVAVPQVKEILSNYGPIAVLWFDTPADMTPERAAAFLPLLALQPGLVVNNRLGGGFHGDTETPEQYIPAQGYPGRDWETCMTMNDTWGFKAYDDHWKSTEKLLQNLIDIASKGGNYLLNVGPTSEGLIPAPSAERLKAIGAWLDVNGEAIYGTGPTAFGPEAGAFSPTKKDRKGAPLFEPTWEWRCTTKPGRLYLHLFRWPAQGFELAGLKGKATRAYLLADPERKPLKLVQNGGSLQVALPPAAPDPIASVLCVELAAAKE